MRTPKQQANYYKLYGEQTNIPTQKEREQAIHREYVSSIEKCSLCGRVINRQEAFYIERWNAGQTRKLYYFCPKCVSRKSQLINLVDSDKINFGLTKSDSFFKFEKRDKTANTNLVESILMRLFKK